MNHPVFGELRNDKDRWHGDVSLPTFAAVGATAEFRSNDYPNNREALGKLDRGFYPFELDIPFEEENAPPSPEQEAAFRHLCEHADAILDALRAELLAWQRGACEVDWFREMGVVDPAESIDELEGQYALVRVGIPREHHNGVSYLVFTVAAPWGDGEHGAYLVYHPEKPVGHGTWDDLEDLTPSDDAPLEPPGPTVHEQLQSALMEGDEQRTAELIAAGGDPTLALFAAVNLGQLEFVRRCLNAGADPRALRHGESALDHARERQSLLNQPMYPPGMTKMFQKFAPEFESVAATHRATFDEIVRLLESAKPK